VAYCPKCRYEYETGVLMCSDCNMSLVDQLAVGAAAAVTPDGSWVVMGQVASQVKSEMAKGSLDSNNIPSMILSSSFGASGGTLGMMAGGHHGGGDVIMVPREYREDAEIILEAVLGDDLIQPDR